MMLPALAGGINREKKADQIYGKWVRTEEKLLKVNGGIYEQ